MSALTEIHVPFKPVSDIKTQEEYVLVYNYWTSALNMLEQNDTNRDRIREYLYELKEQNKRIKALEKAVRRSEMAKRNADEMRQTALKEEAERKKEQTLKATFDREYPVFLERKTQIETEISQLKTRIDELNHSLSELKKGFTNKCVHAYGETKSDIYGNQWRECTICGNKHFVWEARGN